jgi:hypothetical protein
VGRGERGRHLLDLPLGLRRAEVDRGADGDAALLAGLAYRAEHDLVVGVRVRQELVVVQLEQERDPVRVAAGGGTERAERGGDGVAAALDRQLDDAGRVEVVRVLRERRPGRVLDALVDRQDRQVAGAGQAAVRVQRLHRPQHRCRPVGHGDHAVDEVRARQVQALARDRAAGVPEERLCVVAQDGFELGDVRCGCDGHGAPLSSPVQASRCSSSHVA